MSLAKAARRRVFQWTAGIAGLGFATVVAAAPPNDDCAAPVAIPSLPFTDSVDTTEATTAPGDPAQVCVETSSSHSVWYVLTPSATGTVVAETFGSDYDTALSAYTGDCVALAARSCSDDFEGRQSRIAFPVTAGEPVRLEVTGFAQDAGSLVLNVSLSTPPANDTCPAAATVGATPFADILDTHGATAGTDEPNPSCIPAPKGHSVWYAFTAPAAGTLVVDTLGSEYDTVLSAHTGDCQDLDELACSDDFEGLQSRIEVPLLAGQTVRLQAASASPDAGALALNAVLRSVPPNDECPAATLVSGLPFAETLDLSGATTAPSEPVSSCGGAGSHGIWYAVTPSAAGILVVETLGSRYETALAAYAGTCDALTEVACRSTSDTSPLTLPVAAGETSLIHVTGLGGEVRLALRVGDGTQPTTTTVPGSSTTTTLPGSTTTTVPGATTTTLPGATTTSSVPRPTTTSTTLPPLPVTLAPPYLVKDIFPGCCYDPCFGGGHAFDSNPHDLMAVGDTLFFLSSPTPSPGGARTELWRSDGTADGTMLVRDITRPTYHAPEVTNVNGTLFLVGWDAEHGVELWKSDGTPEGTALLRDITPGPDSSYPEQLIAVGDTLFFIVADTPGVDPGLWKSDGTAAGTVPVVLIYPTSSFELPTDVNGTLFFGLPGCCYVTELWKTDGTAQGTVPMWRSVPDEFYLDLVELVRVGDTAFFSAYHGRKLPTGEFVHYGLTLWKSDGTAAGTVPVRNLVPPDPMGIPCGEGECPSGLIAAGETLFFYHGGELWRSDGTNAGTVLVKDIKPGPASPYPRIPARPVASGGRLFFVADDGVHDGELWTSDGTEVGTVMLTDGYEDFFGDLTAVSNGSVFFKHFDDQGLELWRSDGSVAGTGRVGDIEPGPRSGLTVEGSICYGAGKNLAQVGKTLFFPAKQDMVTGLELWALDLTRPAVPTSTTLPGVSTTIPTTSTTTSTLPPNLALETVNSRVAELSDLAGSLVGGGRLRDRLLTMLDHVHAAIEQANTLVAAHKTARARRRLLQAMKTLKKFVRRLNAKPATRQLEPTVRRALIDQAESIRYATTDVRNSL